MARRRGTAGLRGVMDWLMGITSSAHVTRADCSCVPNQKRLWQTLWHWGNLAGRAHKQTHIIGQRAGRLARCISFSAGAHWLQLRRNTCATNTCPPLFGWASTAAAAHASHHRVSQETNPDRCRWSRRAAAKLLLRVSAIVFDHPRSDPGELVLATMQLPAGFAERPGLGNLQGAHTVSLATSPELAKRRLGSRTLHAGGMNKQGDLWCQLEPDEHKHNSTRKKQKENLSRQEKTTTRT